MGVEKLLKLGYEVLYMTEPLDEYVLEQLTEFDGVSLQSAAKDNLKFGNEDSAQMKTIADKVDKVKVSNRLTTTPTCLVSGQYGWTGNMERIMRSQALNNRQQGAAGYQSPKKTMEINSRHPIITALKDKVAADPDDK